MTTKILVADDHPVVRLGLRDLLADEFPNVEIGEARTIEEMHEQLGKRSWDILVLDLSIPGAHGLDAFNSLRERHPDLPVLVLTIHPEDQFGTRAIRAGASGYLNKEAAPQELVVAVRRILGGGVYMSAALAQAMAKRGQPPPPPHDALSEREYQVFRMIAAGKSLTTISRELRVSLKTVSTYKARIAEKTKLLNREQITHYAIRHRLLG